MSYDSSTSSNYYSSGSNHYGDSYSSSHNNSYNNKSPQRDSYRDDDERPAQNFEYNGPIDFDKYDDIPVETSGRDCPRPIAAWQDVELGSAVLNNIEQAGYKKPTPVQKYSLPIVVAGRDLMGCAQTGSGKTAAFLLPIIAQMLKRGPNRDTPRDNKAYPRALILAPTRELAVQIHEEARKFSNRSGIRSVVVYGGASISYQLRDLTRGTPDILVATPGRLVDIIERGNLSLTEVRFLVLDEADRMLDMGFEPQIRRIVERERMPPKGDRQTLMFSATFPHEIQSLAASFLNDYVFLTVGRVGSAAELVTQKFLHTPSESDKEEALQQSLQGATGLTLIFVETKKKASMLDNMLRRRGFKTTSIHGDRSQAERTAALKSFSSGMCPFLIATNVAARGLDISNVTHVINYEMPTNIDDYVHRVGRTGRAGKQGISTAFISEKDSNLMGDLLKVLKDGGQTIPPWLEGMHKPYGGKRSFGGGNRFGGGGHNSGGHRFGGRDFRQHGNHNNNTNNSNGNSSYSNNSNSYWNNATSSYNNRDSSTSSYNNNPSSSSASSSYGNGSSSYNNNNGSSSSSSSSGPSNWVPLQPLNATNNGTNSGYLPPTLNGPLLTAPPASSSSSNASNAALFPQPPPGFFNQLASILPPQQQQQQGSSSSLPSSSSGVSSSNTHTGDRGYKRSYSPSSSSSRRDNNNYSSSYDDNKKYRRDNNNSYDDRRRDGDRDRRDDNRDNRDNRRDGDRDRRDDRYRDSRRDDRDNNNYRRDDRDNRDSRSGSSHRSSSSHRDSRDNRDDNNRDRDYRRDNRDGGDSSYRR